MRRGAYVHPWDLRALEAYGGLARLADLGFTDLSLPTAYHAGKWLTPWSDEGRVRELEDGTVHFAPAEEYGVLRPEPGSEVTGRRSPWSTFGAACREAGLRAWAWTVFFHNSRLGERHPGERVRNAFGDSFSWALCPARPAVREYGIALARDIGRQPGLAVIELEALGWMGNAHSSHHSKSAFPTEPYTDFLLSYCFCDVCRAALAERKVDPEATRARVRELVGARITGGDAMDPAEETPATARERLEGDLGGALAAMLGHRVAVQRALLEDVRRAVPAAVELAVHMRFDPLFTGSQLGARVEDVADLVDEVVVTCYGDDAAAIAGRWQGRPEVSCRRSVGVYPVAPEFTGEEDLRALAEVARGQGLDGVRIYHLGLLPWRTIERVMAVLAER